MDETTSFYSEELCFSGRRSAVECVELLSDTLDTQKLVENVIKSSPMLATPSLDIGKKVETCKETCTKARCIENIEACELRRPTQYTPNTIEFQNVNRVQNTVSQRWESSLTQAVRTTAPDSDTFVRIPSRGAPSPMRSALTIAPAQPFNPQSQSILDPVPLPEQTEPYFPPEHPILPVKKEEEPKKLEKPPISKPKSPFTKALEIAPDRPFTPAGGVPLTPPPVKKKPKDALDKLLDELPRPGEKLDMRSALTTAPDRSYTPLSTEYSSTSEETKSMKESAYNIDRSHLVKPLKPEELPQSFKMNTQEPKPPSYYAPAVIEERIKSETELEEMRKATKSKETRIIEEETMQPGQITQQIITQEAQSNPGTFAPLFQGFSCSFKNKTDHSQFSIEVCTTPPVPTPPPKPQTPISYIATVEERPAKITKQKIIEEKSGSEEMMKRQEKTSMETKQQYIQKRDVQKQDVQKQAEEVIQVKPLPVTTLLHKPETLPSYQMDLKATAEADLILMEKRQKAQQRLEEQKREREQQKIAEVSTTQKTVQGISIQQEALPPKPIINIDPSEAMNPSPSVHFQPVSEKPPSTTFSPRPRSITPSMINKAPPLLPYYQDNLVAQFHSAVGSNVLDPTTPEISRSPSPHPEARSRSPSPFPSRRQERAKSPAEGPPPNPLQSSRPLPTPQDFKIQQAKENVKTYLSGYKSHEEVSGHAADISQVSQNVAYPLSSAQACVQTGKVQQQVDSCEKQRLQITDAQKQECQVAKSSDRISTTNISEKSHQEQLAAERHSQSQTVERSADGITQVQRKKIVTEEYEKSHKETNIQIEKNVTSVNRRPFSKVNVPLVEGPTAQSFHVTNPRHLSFESKELLMSQQESEKLNTQNTLQEASQKLSCQNSDTNQNQSSRIPSSCPVQPPVRHVYPPGSLASIKHVQPPCASQKPSQNVTKPNVPKPTVGSGKGRQAGGIKVAPNRGRGVLNTGSLSGPRVPLCGHCHGQIRGPFITALGKIWCPQHFVCATPSCKRSLQDLGFVEEQGQLYCEYCFEQYLAPPCSKCNAKIKTDCLKAIGKNFHPECFNCYYCGKLFGNAAFFLEDGNPYCENDWNELFTTKCFACGFPVEAGDRWVEALNNNYHSQCFNCTMCKKNLEGQSFFAKGGRPFCKNHAR